eukprot:CAMPEP_0195291938 /NCGR_PEP_ID=MMETSP0707-20130614/8520_1 /TAXON_ID=33640 /ORGANISM="Asterionellopsis glacialis, Strain CCMP134" /LENGTH=217 /DNA_ID=CAMNT_0040352299 /DNA_START=84 /DNA_END=737 /DNA_ORIENTATION=-
MYKKMTNIPTKLHSLPSGQQQLTKAKRKDNTRNVKHSLQQQPRRSVRFSENTNCTRMVEAATPEDKNNSWYNSKEFMGMVKERRSILRHFHQNNHQMPEGETSRGLENFLSAKVCAQKKEKRYQFRRLILLEQHRQRLTGENDPQAFQGLSYMCSEWERTVALNFAKHDAWEAQQVHFQQVQELEISSKSSKINQDIAPRPNINHNISLRLKLARSA